jgi:hypothetical protein
VDSTLDVPLTLAGCRLPQQVQGDEQVRAGCYWEPHDTLPHHLSVSARLVDTVGIEWGRADAAITGHYLVAGRWPMDELVLGRYAVQPIPGIPPGDFYQLELHVYEPDGTVHGAATVGPMTIARPASTFAEPLPSGQGGAARLGGLVLEAATVYPEQILPGGRAWVEAVWQVAEPFSEPRLALEGSTEEFPLLPHSGATAAWEVGDRYRTVTPVQVSPYAMGGPTDVWAISKDEKILVGTAYVEITRAFTVPPETQPLDYRLGDAISLVGTQLVSTGEMAKVVLYWRAETFVEQPYTVFVHLVGPDGRIYGQADALPQAGRHPTTHWLSDEVVADAHLLEWPADAPTGTYLVLAGLYDLATLERLPVTDAGGDPVPDNAIVIGRFEIP